jgi:hypothetical protein
MPDIVISPPNTDPVASEYKPLVDQATALVVQSREQHKVGLEAFKGLGEMEKKIKDLFEPPKKAANGAHKSICAAERKLLGPVLDAKGIVGKKLEDYENEQYRISQEATRKAQEEARKAEEEKQLLDATEAQDAGDMVLAEEIVSQPIEAPVVTVAPQTASVDGVSAAKLWGAEVTDKMALIQYVAAHPEWESLLDANIPNLRRLAIAQHENLSIPGVKAVWKTSRRTRG